MCCIWARSTIRKEPAWRRSIAVLGEAADRPKALSERTALADILGADFRLAEIHKLYRCHDRLLEHKQALFDHLTTAGATCSTPASICCSTS